MGDPEKYALGQLVEQARRRLGEKQIHGRHRNLFVEMAASLAAQT